MNIEDKTAAKVTAGQPTDTTELLQRILNAVEPAKSRHGFEIACAVVLALATTASAWCAYQHDYVLLTVVFASVLFFGGIARAFESRPLRTVLAALAVLLFLGTLVVLATMPICHE